MNKGLGALVFVAGVAVLGYWGAQVYAVRMQAQIWGAAEGVVAQAVHPMSVRVSGRDITVSGTADTGAELATLTAELDAIRGRRVVNLAAVAVLPHVEPYETALAKGADGSLAATGYAPTEAARRALADAGLPVAALPLGHGAPENWPAAVVAGAAALAPLEQGSFALTGTTATLQGQAATPAEEAAARVALDGLGAGFERVVAIEVTDPGVVGFGLDYTAADGLGATGIAPASLGLEDIARALGVAPVSGALGETFAAVPAMADQLAALGPLMGAFDRAEIAGDGAGLSLTGEVLPGLDAASVAAQVADVLGGAERVTLNPAAAAPEGATRTNAATGAREVGRAGFWLALPDFEPTKPACTAAAQAAVADSPILFVTGSAALDPVSLGVVNRVAGIILHCTEGPGMRVIIGGHTDAQGDDNANYRLSVARARAVRDALAARGVGYGRMQPMGYGETEPVADNETGEGRAKNRRTSFEWP